jgi:hypothetical protein
VRVGGTIGSFDWNGIICVAQRVWLFQYPKMETDTQAPPKIETAPALWNPNAAACWSLLFSPAFGAFLHARNAEALGRTEEAKANRVWFYASLAYLGIVLVSIFIPQIPDAVFMLVSMVMLLGWYFTLGKQQIRAVKATLPGGYERNPWTKPLLIAFGCLIGFSALEILLGFAAKSIGIDQHPGI